MKEGKTRRVGYLNRRGVGPYPEIEVENPQQISMMHPQSSKGGLVSSALLG